METELMIKRGSVVVITYCIISVTNSESLIDTISVCEDGHDVSCYQLIYVS